MQVHVKLFAILRERAGESEVVLNMPSEARVRDAVTVLGQQFPALQAYLPRVAFAVNENYAKPETVLRDGDELALIPPVSGG